jgi:hypothetical protein
MPPFRSNKTPSWPHPWVFATSTCATGVTINGVDMPVRLTAGTVWAADDEIVRQRSALFAGECPDELVMRTTPPEIVHVP